MYMHVYIYLVRTSPDIAIYTNITNGPYNRRDKDVIIIYNGELY